VESLLLFLHPFASQTRHFPSKEGQRGGDNGMKKILIIVTVVIVLGLLFWGGQTASKTKSRSASENDAAAISAFSAPEMFHDFGTVSMKAGKVSRMFSVQNKSDAPLTIKRITTSCMCTEAFLIGQDASRKGPFGMPGHGGFAPNINEPVLPQEIRGIEVVFDPAAHGPAGVGRIERAVFIEDATGGMQTLTVNALVIP